MAGATNRAFKAAGIPKAAIKELRVSGGRGMTLRSAISLAGERGIAIPDKAKAHLAARDRKAASSPEGQAAAVDFRAKAAAGLKSMAERKAALQAARQQRVGRAMGDAMKIARGMRQKQAADAAQKAAAVAPAAKANPRTVRALDAASRHMRAGRVAEADRRRRAKTIRDDIHNAARNLPELQGSPKQVAWANELRAKAVKTIIDAHDSTPLMRINGTAWAAMDVASRVRNAKTWIDSRNSVERGDVLGISGMHTREGIKINWERWKKNAPGKR